MGKMVTLNIMRHTYKEFELPDEMEIAWDVNDSRQIAYAEEKFRDYLKDGWIACSEDNSGRVQIFDFNPDLETIVLLPPVGGG
jgi:hypothetical protein